MAGEGKSWMGMMYDKFETFCLEVESTVHPDNLKYVQDQMNTVGENMKKFCVEVIEDVLLPSSEDVKEGDSHHEPYMNGNFKDEDEDSLSSELKPSASVEKYSGGDEKVSKDKCSPDSDKGYEDIERDNEKDGIVCDPMTVDVHCASMARDHGETANAGGFIGAVTNSATPQQTTIDDADIEGIAVPKESQEAPEECCVLVEETEHAPVSGLQSNLKDNLQYVDDQMKTVGENMKLCGEVIQDVRAPSSEDTEEDGNHHEPQSNLDMNGDSEDNYSLDSDKEFQDIKCDNEKDCPICNPMSVDLRCGSMSRDHKETMDASGCISVVANSAISQKVIFDYDYCEGILMARKTIVGGDDAEEIVMAVPEESHKIFYECYVLAEETEHAPVSTLQVKPKSHKKKIKEVLSGRRWRKGKEEHKSSGLFCHEDGAASFVSGIHRKTSPTQTPISEIEVTNKTTCQQCDSFESDWEFL